MEAIRISCAGYPTRKAFAEFVDRFGLLAPEVLDGRCLSVSLSLSPGWTLLCFRFSVISLEVLTFFFFHLCFAIVVLMRSMLARDF